MQDHNGWFDNITKEINRQKEHFSPREYKVFKLDMLIRISKRLNDFFPDCIDCQNIKREMEIITGSLDNLVHSSREEQKNYFNAIDNMVSHLKEKHNLISEGQNLGSDGRRPTRHRCHRESTRETECGLASEDHPERRAVHRKSDDRRRHCA